MAGSAGGPCPGKKERMKMKNLFRVLFVTAILALCAAAPCFAATTKEEYRTESAAVRSEQFGLDSRIDQLRAENFQVAARLSAANKVKIDTKASPIDAETWKQINALRKQCMEISRESHVQKNNGQGEPLKNAVKSGNYTAVMESLNRRLENTKTRLEAVQKKNELWKQIDALLK
jgi:hypothetical protein